MTRAFGIVPAAGRSLRMGRPKLLLPWGSGTLLEHVLAAWRGSLVERTLLVVHPDDHELVRIGTQAGVEVVVAPTAPPDMKASVRCALAALEQRAQPAADDVWLVAPADLPTLTSAAIDAVVRAMPLGGEPIVVPIDAAGQRGHPVRFGWSLASEVSQLPDDAGLNALQKRFSVWRQFVEGLTDADIDTPAEYERLRNRYDTT